MSKFLKKLKRGFTLVELLVVMGIIGVLAAGLIALINPADRVNRAGDTKVLGDMNQVVGASKAYAASNDGSYNITTSAITTWTGAGSLATLLVNELTTLPVPGARAYTVSIPAGPVASTVLLYGTLLSSKYVTGGTCTATGTYAFFSTTNGYLCKLCKATAPALADACTASF